MDISTEISAIQEASRGAEIRQPIVDALNKINTGSLPSTSASDAGKLLYVNEHGNWVAGNEQYIPMPTGAINIDQNGTYDVTNKASAVVSVPGSSSTLIQKTINQNGTYNPVDDNADGYSQVVVNVSGGSAEPFVESQATTYINTGVNGNTVYGIKFEFTPITISGSYQWYLGAANNNLTIASMSTSDGITKGFIRCGNVDFGIITLKKGEKNTIECKNGKVNVNGTELSGTYAGAVNTDSTTIKIFGPGVYSHSRMYRLVLYDANGDTLKDFIPHLDSNYVPCIKDNISGNIIYGSTNKLTYGMDG